MRTIIITIVTIAFVIIALFIPTSLSANSADSEPVFIPPTDADQVNGWNWASPSQPIASQPVLFNAVQATFTVCYFSLPVSCAGSCYRQLKGELCPGVDVDNPYPPVSNRTITLREWCGLARIMSGASFPKSLDGWVCGK